MGLNKKNGKSSRNSAAQPKSNTYQYVVSETCTLIGKPAKKFGGHLKASQDHWKRYNYGSHQIPGSIKDIN